MESLNQAEHSNSLGLSAKIAIIDDEPINIKVVRKHLQVAGYQNFVTTTDSTTAAEFLSRERPDIVLLDVMMPQVSGIDILEWIRSDARLLMTPVLILTASTDAETKLRALNAGATDFLAKPVDANDLAPRIRNALIVKAHHDHLATYSERLEHQVRVRTAELEASRLQVIHCLARAAEFRDDVTGDHVLRVGSYVGILAGELGFSPADVQMISLASLLHDVGKIGLPDAILMKPGKLTPQEFDVVRRHCNIGLSIMQPTGADKMQVLFGSKLASEAFAANPLLEMATRIAHCHHERWDGAGYPRGLAGDAIPLEARITSVADVFDALNSERPYKPGYPIEQCLTILEQGRSTQFDPAVLDAMQRRIADIARTGAALSDQVRLKESTAA